jgi:hypothetical protein
VAFIKDLLENHEKSLKKLTISCDFAKMLVDLKDLRLEELELLGSNGADKVPLDLLKQSSDLKSLKLIKCYTSDEIFKKALEIESLECLEVERKNEKYFQGLYEGFTIDRNGLEPELVLKRLGVYVGVSRILLCLFQFDVLHYLEELEVYLMDGDVSLKFVKELNGLVPNLKKIVIHYSLSENINALLDTMKNLESITIINSQWIFNEKVYPKIKHIDTRNVFTRIAIGHLFVNRFPNLETLHINYCFVNLADAKIKKSLES